MKKTLFELTIEEFTSVLLDYEPILTLSISAYDEKGNFINKQLTDGTDEEINVQGRYSDFQNTLRKSNSNNGMEKATRDFLKSQFDYDIQINRLDIYNYLEHITCDFQAEKVKIVLSEMECFYNMIYLEDIDKEVKNKYIENEWEFPTMDMSIPDLQKNGEYKTHKVVDLGKMREKLYPFRDFTYLSAVSLLKRKTPSQQPLKSPYTITKRCKTDFVKIVSAMYDCHLFETTEGKIASNKEDLLNTLGQFFNVDLSASSTLLNEAKKKNNYLDIFDKIKEKGEQYYKKGL